jgi:hypothetical protein
MRYSSEQISRGPAVPDLKHLWDRPEAGPGVPNPPVQRPTRIRSENPSGGYVPPSELERK